MWILWENKNIRAIRDTNNNVVLGALTKEGLLKLAGAFPVEGSKLATSIYRLPDGNPYIVYLSPDVDAGLSWKKFLGDWLGDKWQQ